MKNSSTRFLETDAVPTFVTTYFPVFFCGYLFVFDVYACVCVWCEIHRTSFAPSV